MKHTLLIGALSLTLAISLYFNFTGNATAQVGAPVAMTGDQKATWIVTDTNDLVFCWWDNFPPRRDERLNCRANDKWNVDKL